MYTVPGTNIHVKKEDVKTISLSQTSRCHLKRTYKIDIELKNGNIVNFDFTCWNHEYAVWLLNEIEKNTICQM